MLTQCRLALHLICAVLAMVTLQSCGTRDSSVARSTPARNAASTAPRTDSRAAPREVTMDVKAVPYPAGLVLGVMVTNGESYPIKNVRLEFRCLVAEKADGTDVRVTHVVKPTDWQNYTGGIIPAGAAEELVTDFIPWSSLLDQSPEHYRWGIWELYSKGNEMVLGSLVFQVTETAYDKAD